MTEVTYWTGPPPAAACSKCGATGDDHNLRLGVDICTTCSDAIDAADPISAVARGHGLFSATYQGQTYRFHAAEHHNIGPGWMCVEIDGRLPLGVYCSSRLTDIVAIEPADDMPEIYRLRGARKGVTRIVVTSSPSELDPTKVRFNITYRSGAKDTQ